MNSSNTYRLPPGSTESPEAFARWVCQQEPSTDASARSLYEELTNRRMTVIDAIFWFGLGVLSCILIQTIR